MKKIFKEDEDEIISFIKNNPEDCIEMGITKLAKINYTSTSAIVRIAKKLGYLGYTDMVYSMKKKVKNKTDLDINIETKYRVRNVKEIKLFINCLLEKKIAVYGEDFSRIIGTYIHNRLFTLGIESHFLDCINSKLFFDGIGQKYDTIILISNTGESEKCMEIINNAKESKKNYTIISFTGKRNNSIADNSDVSFVIEGIATEDKIVKYPNPFYGNVILGFEELLMIYLEEKRKVKKI
ncbi:hypothetical protein [uncultured Ilyobacter sp.]|uniref:MurR/RpiR family transcriptional regulator n=1 Tax=uncultured Ilyobacter sp. TaxID=544433 RepID=UPI0029C6C7D4|nr:hypothetical protein [uncultured Ilyobacter sp.]